jgi:hypothetical protein
MSRNKMIICEQAIDDLFSDTSVSIEQTLDRMIELRANIDMKIGCLDRGLAIRRPQLRQDIKKAGGGN